MTGHHLQRRQFTVSSRRYTLLHAGPGRRTQSSLVSGTLRPIEGLRAGPRNILRWGFEGYAPPS
jgi:hypothetical protein